MCTQLKTTIHFGQYVYTRVILHAYTHATAMLYLCICLARSMRACTTALPDVCVIQIVFVWAQTYLLAPVRMHFIACACTTIICIVHTRVYICEAFLCIGFGKMRRGMCTCESTCITFARAWCLLSPHFGKMRRGMCRMPCAHLHVYVYMHHMRVCVV